MSCIIGYRYLLAVLLSKGPDSAFDCLLIILCILNIINASDPIHDIIICFFTFS